MFNINNYPDVTNYLRSVSGIFKKIGSTEYQMYCPYCGDSTRRSNPSHGHLYLAVNSPVFNCFRCDMSGLLVRLLDDVEYENRSIIDEISSFISVNYVKDHSKRIIIRNDNNIVKKIENINNKFKESSSDEYIKLSNYLVSRIGELIDYNKFGIVFGEGISFINSNSELISTRYITGKKRYKIYDNTSGLYFFQSWDFERYKSIVLAEGIFDIINLYLYNRLFRGSLFIAINGKKYISTIERLMSTEITIGNYDIHCIFDKDVKSYGYFLNKSRNIIENINNNINLYGYLPMFTNDVGDYPVVNII